MRNISLHTYAHVIDGHIINELNILHAAHAFFAPPFHWLWIQPCCELNNSIILIHNML